MVKTNAHHGRALSVRLSAEQATQLSALALFEGVSSAEIVRQAIDTFVETRRRDPQYIAHLRNQLDRKHQMLENFVGEVDPDDPTSEPTVLSDLRRTSPTARHETDQPSSATT